MSLGFARPCDPTVRSRRIDLEKTVACLGIDLTENMRAGVKSWHGHQEGWVGPSGWRSWFPICLLFRYLDVEVWLFLIEGR